MENDKLKLMRERIKMFSKQERCLDTNGIAYLILSS